MNRPPIKFISTTLDAGIAKTKRTQHACDDCRKRKRRCPHDYQTFSHSSSSAVNASADPIPATENRQRRLRSHKTTIAPSKSSSAAENNLFYQNSTANPSSAKFAPVAHRTSTAQPDGTGSANRRPTEGGEPKFVGHLNPEGFFLATARLGACEASEHGGTLGFWLPQESYESLDDAGQGSVETDSESLPQRLGSGGPEPAQTRIGSTEILPTPSSFQNLRAIYFQDIHPVFPILHPEIVPRTVSEPPHTKFSPEETAIIQTLCVAVSTNAAARSHLRLQHYNDEICPRTFTCVLSRSILATIDRFRIKDRLLLTRVFTILSLFSSFSTDDHTAAEYCARAVSNVHTMQLQLDTFQVRRDHAVVSQTFLCVWALDRLNAAFHSRPILMHAPDIGRDMTASIAGQRGCFRALLMMCDLLDKVIHLYRPYYLQTNQENSSLDIPSFDELIIRADATHCPTHLLATIEPLYHTVAILSHRFHSLDDPDRSSISYLRSSLSTARLLHLVRTSSLQPLSNFPFVPYSLALALRVSYRELRLSKTPLYRSQARGQVLFLCTVLEEFGNNYCFTKNLARLARKIICEMDKVAASVLQARHKDTDHLAGSAPVPNLTHESAQVAQSSADSTSVMPEHHDPPLDGPTVLENHGQFEPPHIPEYEPGQYDAERFDDIYKFSDLPDMFEHFDPDFNLEAVEFSLLQNLGLDPVEGIDFIAQTF